MRFAPFHLKERTMFSNKFAVAVVVAVFALAVDPASHAQAIPSFSSMATASGGYSYDNGFESGNLNESKSSRVGVPVEVRGGFGNLEYEAGANAAPGSLSAFAATEWEPSPYYSGNSVSANGSASVSDYFVIYGGAGVAAAGVEAEIHGFQTTGDDIFSSGSSSYGFSLVYSNLDPFACYHDPTLCTPADQTQYVLSESRYLSGNARPIRFSNEYETDFLFRYGQPFQLNASLNAGASYGGQTDLASTATFSLELPDGAYMVSASGFGYVAAVPEPGTYLLMALGLAGLALDRRRRTQRRH